MLTLNDTGKRRGIFLRATMIITCTAVCLIIYTGIVSAEGTTLLDALKTCEIDATTSIYREGFRMIGFGILKGLGKLSDSLYNSLTYIFESIDITYSSQVGALVRKYRIIYKLLFTISVAAFGLYLIARTNTGQLNTLNCIMLIFLVLAAMPLMTEKLAKLTEASSGYVQSKWVAKADDMKVESLSGTIMKDYIIDLEKVDKNIPSDNPGALKKAIDNNSGYNYFKNGGKAWRYIDINEPMNYNDETYEKDFWDKKLEEKDGTKELVDMSESWLDKLDTYYYRYQMTSWLSPILMMLVLCVVFLFSGFRCATMIIEIIQAEIYMPLVAVTDLASGQRIKEGLKHFLTLFAGIFLCVALLGIYFICYSWINAKIDNITAQIIFQLALAWAVLNGPNAIERILGVDVGVKDGWKILLGLNAAKATGAAGMAAVAAAGNAVSKPVKAAAGAMREHSGKKAHEAMEQEKGAAGRYEDRSAETGAAAGRDAAGREAKTDPMSHPQNKAAGGSDPMSQPENGTAESSDPMSEKSTNISAPETAGNRQQGDSGQTDPMSGRTAAETGRASAAEVKDASLGISGRNTAGSDPMNGRGRPHEPVSASASQSYGSIAGAVSMEHDPLLMKHGTDTNSANASVGISESKTAVLDGRPVDLKKGEI